MYRHLYNKRRLSVDAEVTPETEVMLQFRAAALLSTLFTNDRFKMCPFIALHCVLRIMFVVRLMIAVFLIHVFLLHICIIVMFLIFVS